jgi:ribosomal protein S18 acetylase RimI-like enzyme
MSHVKNAIEIVQYHEGWAKEVAKMWNLSRDGWGGDTRVMTEEQVKKKEANSDNIELYLAVDGMEVVGYCSLSEYKEDTGSLYIPLLNVRSDYQGKKIGKMLVLRALDKTIELGWPRLDLYTWAGNTKAVPLYKKCGFFWEDRDDTTHLMNFIPQVLQTPLLRPAFSEFDWYYSSNRIIEVKPDGTKENGFTFYEYSWKKEDKVARVQFERTGRGMSLIETDEFLLQISLKDHEIIEQLQQSFEIKFINKTGTPVSFKVSGASNERVQYSIQAEMIVDTEATITEHVIVKPGEEPSVWRTHPYVAVNIWIDGQECELRLGVFPVQPAKVESFYSGNLCSLNKETVLELVVKNHLKEETTFEILFPTNDQVTLTSNHFSTQISAGARRNIKVPLIVNSHGFYQPTLLIKAIQANGTVLQFEQEISAAFKGLGEKFGGESKEYWHVYNGLLQVNVRKRDLLLSVAKNTLKKQPLAFFPPKLGKPYANEFTKKKPNTVSWEVTDTSILLKMELQSGEMDGLFLTQMIQLFGDGIVHKWIEIENRGSQLHEDVAISMPHFHELGPTYFPLDDQVVYFSEKRIIEFGDLKPTSLTENWYFSENTPAAIGIAWSGNSKATPDGWQFVVEDEMGSLASGEIKKTEKVVISIGAFGAWEDFRAFAQETAVVERTELSAEHYLESHQLVVETDISLTLKTHRNGYLNGQLIISKNNQELLHETISANEEVTDCSWTLKPSLDPVSIIEGEFQEESKKTQFNELILAPTNSPITSNTSVEEGFKAVEAINGTISIKAAPDFYPGIYSLKVNGKEWLDHSFPNLTAKSWWNPWAGGMKTAPTGLNTFSLKKETHSACIVDQYDRQGNKWSGIAIHTDIHEHSHWKGVQYIQYYLMLPGIPVLASYLEVKNSAGKNLNEESWSTDFFVGGEDLPNLSVNVNGNQQTNKYVTGVQELPFHFDIDCYIASETKQEKLYLVPSLYSLYTEAYTNKDAFQLLTVQSSLPKENGSKTAPMFLFFDQRQLSDKLLMRLRRIQF